MLECRSRRCPPEPAEGAGSGPGNGLHENPSTRSRGPGRGPAPAAGARSRPRPRRSSSPERSTQAARAARRFLSDGPPSAARATDRELRFGGVVADDARAIWRGAAVRRRRMLTMSPTSCPSGRAKSRADRCSGRVGPGIAARRSSRLLVPGLLIAAASLASAPGCSSCFGSANSCRRPSFMEFRSPCARSSGAGCLGGAAAAPCGAPAQPCQPACGEAVHEPACGPACGPAGAAPAPCCGEGGGTMTLPGSVPVVVEPGTFS